MLQSASKCPNKYKTQQFTSYNKELVVRLSNWLQTNMTYIILNIILNCTSYIYKLLLCYSIKVTAMAWLYLNRGCGGATH